MGRSVNRLILVGNLRDAPSIHYTQDGAIATVFMATNEEWIDRKSGERKSHTEWHKIVFFNQDAENAARILRKGDLVHIEGFIRTCERTDTDGQEYKSKDVITEGWNILGRARIMD